MKHLTNTSNTEIRTYGALSYSLNYGNAASPAKVTRKEAEDDQRWRKVLLPVLLPADRSDNRLVIVRQRATSGHQSCAPSSGAMSSIRKLILAAGWRSYITKVTSRHVIIDRYTIPAGPEETIPSV